MAKELPVLIPFGYALPGGNQHKIYPGIYLNPTDETTYCPIYVCTECSVRYIVTNKTKPEENKCPICKSVLT